MKQLLLTAVFSILLLSAVTAQTTPKGVFLHHESVMNELNLDAEQRAKVFEIKKVTDVKLRAITANTALSPEELKQEKLKFYAERTKMQNDILNPEQVKKFKQMKADAKKANQ